MVSARMKPFSKSVWMAPAARGAFEPGDGPGTGLLGSSGEERDQMQHPVALPDEGVEPGLREPQLLQILGAVRRLERGQLRLKLGANDDAAGALGLRALGHLRRQQIAGDVALVDVA